MFVCTSAIVRARTCVLACARVRVHANEGEGDEGDCSKLYR